MTGRSLRMLAVALAGLACAFAGEATPATGSPTDLADAMTEWLESLDADQRSELGYAFQDDERLDLRLAPMFLEGLRRDALSDAQWQGLRGVLGLTLSAEGLRKVEAIMALEREVRIRDRESFVMRLFGGFIHGEQLYYLALFGEPGIAAPWGLRFDGHHVSLNWTAVPERDLSVTPLFLGAEPRRVPEGREAAGLRVLAAEEDAGWRLWDSLDAAARERARLSLEPASGVANRNRPLARGEDPIVVAAAPEGLARATMTPTQQRHLDALIDIYLANFASAIADQRRAALDAAGRDAIHFAHTGGDDREGPSYYRVQGPTFLLEFDNTVPAADHVHTVWREFDGDFGRDLLAEHHARHHSEETSP